MTGAWSSKTRMVFINPLFIQTYRFLSLIVLLYVAFLLVNMLRPSSVVLERAVLYFFNNAEFPTDLGRFLDLVIVGEPHKRQSVHESPQFSTF